MKANEIGRRGERAAAEHLEAGGCGILSANYRTRFGEIDLIACEPAAAGKAEGFLIFAEVKTRRESAEGLPREAVGRAKQRRIVRAALEYLAAHPTRLQPRFDVIEVVTAVGEPWSVRKITWLKNAFSLTDIGGGNEIF